MTVHAHDPALPADGARPGPTGGATATTPARPRWLVPGLAVGVVVAVLVAAGVVSFSTVLTVGLIGGMFAMHLGGHGGHAGHGSHGNGADEQAPAEERANQARDDGERPMRGCH